MYPYYKGKQGSQVVGYDDVLAMYELYSEYIGYTITIIMLCFIS